MHLGKAAAPVDTRLYAIGDIHGCIDHLTAMFDVIEVDLASNPVGSHQIITLGDYVDRGPGSRAVLDYLVAARKTHPLVCLMGNHDERMLEFIAIPHEVGDSFLHYGGRELLASYDVDVFRYADFGSLSNAFARTVPRSHLSFLNSLQLTHEAGDYFFCHAGIRPNVPLDEQEARDLLWIRNEFLIYQKPHPRVIVHGHTPGEDVDIHPNRINVDSGCFATGVLSCIVLEGREHRKLQINMTP